MGDRFVVYIHDSYDGGNTEYTDSAPCKVKLKVGRHVTEISFPHAISPLSMVLYLLCPRRSLPAPAARRWSRTASSSASTSATVQRSAARTRTTCMVPSTDPTRERFCARQKRPYRCSHQERRGHHRIQAHCNWDGAAGGGFAGSVECVEGCREDFFVASIFIKNGWLFSWTACGKIIKSSKVLLGELDSFTKKETEKPAIRMKVAEYALIAAFGFFSLKGATFFCAKDRKPGQV